MAAAVEREKTCSSARSSMALLRERGGERKIDKTKSWWTERNGER